MQEIKVLIQEMKKRYAFWAIFKTDRHCGLQRYSMQSKGISQGQLDPRNLDAKNQGPKSRDKKDKAFLGNYDRLTDRPTDMRPHREVPLPIILHVQTKMALNIKELSFFLTIGLFSYLYTNKFGIFFLIYLEYVRKRAKINIFAKSQRAVKFKIKKLFTELGQSMKADTRRSCLKRSNQNEDCC